MTLTDAQGDVCAILCNYPCHPVFYPATDTISGEFPGRVSQLLESRYYGATALYTQSSAGDVRPRPTVKTLEDGTLTFQKLPFSAIDAFAKSMADCVSDWIEKGKWKTVEPSFAADAFTIELAIRPAPLAAFAEKLAYQKRKNIPGNPDWLNAEHALNGGYDDMAEHVTIHGQTLRISDSLYVVAMGGEPCFGVKNAVKKAFDDKDVCFIGYTDDCAYLVDDYVLSEGGYEAECHIEYNLKGPFQAGVDEKYIEGFSASRRRIENQSK